MKLHHIIAGLLGLFILAAWACVCMTISWTFTGKAFPNE